MIQITPHMRILLATEPVDFRKGIDGLCALCRHKLESDPFSGALFVFCNRQRTSLRILVYDGQGFWLCHKRLSTGRFCWLSGNRDLKMKSLVALELQTLLWNGNLKGLEAAPSWRSISSG